MVFRPAIRLGERLGRFSFRKMAAGRFLTSTMRNILSHKSEKDGIVIEYMLQVKNPAYPYILLVLPFGATLDSSDAFFDMFGDIFNIVTWKSRHIFDDGHDVKSDALKVDSHVDDIATILGVCNINSAIIVGYCSGAAIALCAATKYNDYFSSMFLVCGEYALSDQKQTTSHYKEVDLLLKNASKSIKYSTLIAKKFGESKNNNKDMEAKYFNKPYYNPTYLHRYSINYLNFIDVNYLHYAKEVPLDTFVYCSDEDMHVGTEASTSIKDKITNSTLVLGSFGDHYEFCKPGASLLTQLKNDCMRYCDDKR